VILVTKNAFNKCKLCCYLTATLRLSALRQLPWYSGGNYQGKDMAHVQETVAQRVAVASASSESDGASRQLFRAALATLPRGGGNGDDIRLGILEILRENGITEGHRPVGLALFTTLFCSQNTT
jgi:alpha-glucan,water dikinase